MPIVAGCGDCEYNPGLCDTHTEPGEYRFRWHTPVLHWDDREGQPGVDWVYIGRKGEGYFGNPYFQFDRATNIALFRAYFYARLDTDEVFRLAVHGLKGKVLVCHCKPLPCHGDVIAEYLSTL